jgi:UDP-N-acetylmuramoyl-tripeptide--D-alanyl-D-alanine ligase
MATPIPTNGAELTAWEVAAATGGDLVRVATTCRPAVGFVTDSRAAGKGSGFVAIRGATLDGHAFIGDVIAKGASLIVVQRGTPRPENADIDIVEVSDTLVAWGAIARAHLVRWRRQASRTATVAITGSTGKTTTKEICAALLRRVGPCHATSGNLNNRVGVPAVALGVEAKTRFAVFEVGMSEPGEIAALARIVVPDVAVLVNAGVAHAGGVGGTRADVAREKGALVEALGPSGTAIVNLDDEAAAAQAMRCVGRVETFGKDPRATCRLVHRASLGARGSKVEVERKGERYEGVLPLLGEGAVIDFVAALAAAEAALGATLAPASIDAALLECRPLGGRARLTRLGGDILAIDDTYNANPASMQAALDTLAEVAREGRRMIAVLGEMRELGTIAEREHDALGEALARAGVKLVIGCGGMVDRALDRAAALGVTVLHGRTTAEAAELACKEIRAGDAVLLKGSRAASVETVLTALERAHGPGGPGGIPPGKELAS